MREIVEEVVCVRFQIDSDLPEILNLLSVQFFIQSDSQNSCFQSSDISQDD